ncbi:MAG: hypothetical protein CMF76_09150, partial [Maricaulis sp.]|nr:hypothetical protein [Maricaulis sp.]
MPSLNTTQFVSTFYDLLAQLHAETISETDFETALISAFDSWVGLYASNPVLAQRLVQVLARIDGVVVTEGAPDNETGEVGAIAVDVTNFVMMESGQPLHAFDMGRVEQEAGLPTIIVRYAEEGEVIETLNDEKHELKSTDLVIADPVKAVALAGVMGGALAEVTDSTTSVLL